MDRQTCRYCVSPIIAGEEVCLRHWRDANPVPVKDNLYYKILSGMGLFSFENGFAKILFPDESFYTGVGDTLVERLRDLANGLSQTILDEMHQAWINTLQLFVEENRKAQPLVQREVIVAHCLMDDRDWMVKEIKRCFPGFADIDRGGDYKYTIDNTCSGENAHHSWNAFQSFFDQLHAHPDYSKQWQAHLEREASAQEIAAHQQATSTWQPSDDWRGVSHYYHRLSQETK